MTDAVVEYLGALQAERGASRNTLSAYRRDLTDFTHFLSDHQRSLRRAGPDDIVGYLERLRARGLRPSSVARRISALRGLYRHLVREGTIRRDPTEHLETPRRARALPRTLSREVVAALVESPAVSAARRARPGGARAPVRHRHARVRVPGPDPRRRQPQRGLRRVHGQGPKAAARPRRRRSRAVGEPLPPRRPPVVDAGPRQRPAVRE